MGEKSDIAASSPLPEKTPPSNEEGSLLQPAAEAPEGGHQELAGAGIVVVRHRQRRRQRAWLDAIYWIGVILLSIPLLLLVVCTIACIYNIECPIGSTAPAAAAGGGSKDGAGQRVLSSYHPLSPELEVPEIRRQQPLQSNGTHLFHPTLILVSLDGFRPDYLSRGITPNLLRIGRGGLRADYMIPSFPSSTFPNHYSIVTGLYPGAHGIVSNEFYDSGLNATFVYKSPEKSIASEWWNGGEPIWVTAERQGLKAGIDMWPGSTSVIRGYRPSYVIPFAENVHPTVKAAQLLEWLDLPLDRRPSFLATYMPEVDHAAHGVGPDGKPVDDAVRMVDEALGFLSDELARRNLTRIVNLMVVSDHGMAAVKSRKHAIYVDDIIDMDRVQGLYGWPLGGIQPKDARDVPEMYQKLAAASEGKPWKVYLRKDIPARFHYANERRVAPLYIIPEIPWYVSTRAMDQYHARLLPSADQYPTIGAHGYDNLHPLMRATFVASGPAFRSRSATPLAQPRGTVALNATLIEQFTASRAAAGGDDPQGDVASLRKLMAAMSGPFGGESGDGDDGDGMGMESPSELWASGFRHYQAEYDRIWNDRDISDDMRSSVRHPPFENVELYALMARILGLNPAPNNGTSMFHEWWLSGESA